MTKTIVTLLLTVYSLTRLILVGFYYYYQSLTLPTAVYVITGICAAICLAGASVVYLKRISGKKLRLLLAFNALCTAVNLFIVYNDTSSVSSVWDLMITGTFFDILFFFACCTIKLRDTAYMPAGTPFTRLGAKNNSKRLRSGHEEKQPNDSISQSDWSPSLEWDNVAEPIWQTEEEMENRKKEELML